MRMRGLGAITAALTCLATLWTTPPAIAVDNRPVWVPNGTVYAIATHDGVVYIGGKFTPVSNPSTGQSRAVGRLAAFDQATGALISTNGTVYAGGHFGPEFDNSTRNQLAAVRADNGRLLPFAPTFTDKYFPGVWDIAVDTDYLRIGGGFNGLNGTAANKYGELSYPV